MKNELTAKRLQIALSNKNMKPQELANKSGVSKASISQYVNGSHAPSNLSSGKLAKVLDVSPLWLMGFDVPMHDLIKEDKNNNSCNTNDDAIQIAKFVSDNPEYKPLFDASCKVKKEDIPFVKEMIDRVSNTNTTPYDSVPDTPEELERLYPPVDINEWKKKNRSNK